MMIHPELIRLLNLLLHQFPASVDSLIRTEAHNHAVGGAPRSGHVSGSAADLLFDDPLLLIPAGRFAMQLGFTGVEVDLTNQHLHVDILPRTWRVVKSWNGETALTDVDPKPPGLIHA